jgi:hypothetical protein
MVGKWGKNTTHNRSVSVRRLTAARLRKTPVGACAPLWRFAPPHFFAPDKEKRCAFFLIGRKKTSLTAGTLYAICT